MTLGENLQRLRKAKGISQDEVAEKLFVSRQSVSKWETGKAEPGIDSLKKLSRLYGVTIDELVANDASVEQENSWQPYDLFQLAVLVRFLTAMYGICFAEVGLVLYCWDLPILLTGYRFQNQLLWGTALAVGGTSLFVNLIITAKALLDWEYYNGYSFLIVSIGIALMLILLLQKKTRSYFCSRKGPIEAR